MAEQPPIRRRRMRFFLLAAGACVVVGGLALGGLYRLSSSPLLCNSCHIMKPYVEAWRASKHSNVTCIDCHYPPELRGTIWVKYQALAQVAKWATQTYSSKPFAEVEDASCLRAGCHTSRLLEGKVTFKRGIIFDHGPHLKEKRRGRQLRCTSCHSQIVVGTHIEVTTTTCYLCHFKGMKTSREFHPLGGCTVCHTAPKADIQMGTITFNHESMVKRNVGCEKCHLNVVEGDGQAPRERCYTCHNQPEKLQKYADTSFMHEFHVTGHHIECTRCHSEISHKLPPPIGLSVSRLWRWLSGPTSAEAAENDAQAQPKRLFQPPPVTMPEVHPAARDRELDCKACHQATHRGVLEMYIGMGGKGTPMIPGHMFQVRVECVACHVEPGKDKALEKFSGRTFRPSERACLGCHGTRYKGMLERWTKTINTMLTAVNAKLLLAEQALQTTGRTHPQFTKARQLAADARHNVEFVTHGKGVHNVFFAADLLKVAAGYLDQSMAAIGQSPPSVADETLVRGGYCAVLCHNQAGVRAPEDVTFGAETIPHIRHVTDFGVTCTACHSAEQHKAVTATKETCLSCHHRAGNNNERCIACHKLQYAFFSGTIEIKGVEPAPSSHAQLTDCVGCHNVQAKHSRQAVAGRCLGCHDTTSLKALAQWRKDIGRGVEEAMRPLRKGESSLRHAPQDPRAPEARLLLQATKRDLDLVVKAGGVHNPDLAKAILVKAKESAERAVSLLNR
ncbi:MAG: NapC/NirT family cytochrome c [candidate division NC10 bacterium]|nr:NapC/NirT family cytochrome c [candidate division NC10 bacterium]